MTMVCDRAQEGGVILARDDHADFRGDRAMHEAVVGTVKTALSYNAIDELVLKALAEIRRITIIGKDCVENRMKVPHLCELLFSGNSALEKVYTGVEIFADICNAEALKAARGRFQAQCFGRPDFAGSYDLAWRLGALMDTDLVIMLPEAGRMTCVEAMFAQESGLNVVLYTDAESAGGHFFLYGGSA